jgi:L-threonylcarbamoyladenylate synthase
MSDNLPQPIARSGPQVVPADAAGIARAAGAILSGEAVGVPTETVYGLAARADKSDAVARIYKAKGRPDFNPLIVHVADLTMAGTIGELDSRAQGLAQAFWPGPLTLVVPLRKGARIAGAVSAGLPTIALRCPAHGVMQSLLSQLKLPLAAPSANRSGSVSPTNAQHVARSLGRRIDLVLDGGECARGLESTIVALRENSGWQILRPGPVSREQIAEILGSPETAADRTGIEAPGQLASHYAPGKPVRLDAERARDGEFMIGFGAVAGDVSLSPSGDPDEAAARLYDCLHAAALSEKPRVAVASVPGEGIAEAIRDRLRRAAA